MISEFHRIKILRGRHARIKIVIASRKKHNVVSSVCFCVSLWQIIRNMEYFADIVVDDENRLMVLDVLNRRGRNDGKKQ